MTVLAEAANRDRSASVGPLITANGVVEMSELADQVHVDKSLLGYVSRLAQVSRRAPHVRLGVSVRGCLAWVRTAKTWAAAEGRHYVIPDDIKELAIPVLGHRLLLDAEAEFGGVAIEDVIAGILAEVTPPAERAPE
jgi:MoxR-like ATPase